MLLDISLNVYKSFIEVYKTGNISKASKRLYISQPAVSLNIKTLEKQLGCVMFVKAKGVLKPTAQAQTLFKHLINSFSELELAEQELIYDKNINKGLIKLGCQTHIFTAILAKYIAKFNKIYPNITFELFSRSTEDMIKQLNNCDLDMILDTSPINRPSDAIIVKPFLTVDNVFCSKNSDTFPNELEIDELMDYPLITPILNSKTIDALKEKVGDIELRPIITSTTSESIISLVKNGAGIGYVMKNYIEDDLNNSTLKIVNIKKKELPITKINICYNKSNITEINRLFMDFLINQV